MSLKIAAESYPKPPSETVEEPLVVVRDYDEERHKIAIEKLERLCEIGQRGKPSLVTDLMGDPICRIRHFQLHVMLVAEYGEEGEVVGVIRGCVKTVTRRNSVYVKLAYLLGLRVSPRHRRFGIGTKLVEHLEEWCKQKGAKYAYMATDCTNEPSINLFTKKCGYSKFRTLTILVQPVHAHYKPISSSVAVLHLPPRLAVSMYNHIFANSEFYPKDIDLILSNKLNLGTFMAMPKKYLSKFDPKRGILPPSFAILSVWNTKEVFKLQVKGVSPLAHACCIGTRLLDEWMPWLRLPSFPDVFRPFGVYFLYGLHMEGKCGAQLMKRLCGFVHNMAKDDDGCGAIVAELGQRDPVRDAVPHWTKFSWAEDIWCIKNLQDIPIKCGPSDWVTSRSSSSVIFVDPRDF
ncbi:probable N-acetyltransferase HLS1 [Abrus precatorius]|uniref:Probable N-acetyltransferase HLS1 n=1 Tax=Abrus precatorius TaxID=3816 RepID=A0A8B8KQB0_ABRPR|nr:probable N-acetyltransferase HLS1 [Abrus precatorius]